MIDKPAFKSLLQAYGRAEREWEAATLAGHRSMKRLCRDVDETRAAVLAAYDAAAGSDRPCTCHPDDKPPVPCPKKYALTECRNAAAGQEGQPVAWRYSIAGDIRFAETREEADAENATKDPEERWIEPLFTHPAPKADAGDLECLGNLVRGIRHWAAQEDGIPDFLAPSYADAMMRLGWSFTTNAELATMTHVLQPKADAAAYWVCVPREPTDAMRRAAQVADMYHSDHEEWLEEEWPDHLRIYQALLAASPARGGEGAVYEALAEAEKALAFYESLPKDQWPGPPTTALALVRAAMSREAQG